MLAAGLQGQVPAGAYTCVLRDPDRAGETTYGRLSVRAAAYRLERTGEATQSGTLHATPGGQLMWNGPLGPIDAQPRRISRGRISTRDDAVNLTFDFAPALPGPPPSTQLLCRMTIGADL
jgi:hypothetical protein